MNIDFDEFLKSDKKAAALRHEGNLLYNDGKFFEALLKYNESLCFAEEELYLAFAYANRSAVYFEVKLYQQCLNNIQLAREHNYPLEKTKILEDREERCLELMMQGTKIAYDPFEHFKLSYNANPKIPFIIEGLKIETNKEYGRHIVTKDPLKVGDIISIESPFFSVLHSDPSFDINAKATNKFSYCHFCLDDKVYDLVPCSSCNGTMYCNDDCAISAFDYHQYECVISRILQESRFEYMPKRSFFKALSFVGGSIKELEKMYNECQKSPKTTFDFDFNNREDPEYQKNQLRAALCLAKDGSVETFDFSHIEFEIHPLMKTIWATHEKFIRKFLLHLYQIQRHTISSIERYSLASKKQETVGAGNFLFGAYINHSCSPNVMRLVVKNKMCLIVIRAIATGEQLFDCYTQSFYEMPKKQRQATLKQYSIQCHCEACKNPRLFSMLNQLEVFDQQLFVLAESSSREDYEKMSRKKVIKSIQNIKKQMDDMCKNGKYPSREYCLMITTFHKCLIQQASLNNIF
jgi:tetratricopeptide (TPR) repeat protein